MTEPTFLRDTVVLVDPSGAILGTEEKLAAHEAPGHLHLAFSVVLFRPDGQMLIQQRAAEKYHFPLLWANACCSHPAPGEPIAASAKRRVMEELGMTVALEEVGSFIYQATCATSGRVEHELDHVFVGTTNDTPECNPEEVAALRWVDPAELASLVDDGVTVPWLMKAVQMVEASGWSTGNKPAE